MYSFHRGDDVHSYPGDNVLLHRGDDVHSFHPGDNVFLHRGDNVHINDSPELSDRGDTSDIPGLPSGEILTLC